MSNSNRPQIVISFGADGVAIELNNWEKGGITPVMIENAFYQVHRHIHQFRARKMQEANLADAAKREVEKTSDPLTEGAKINV